jgi:hypothetical protein
MKKLIIIMGMLLVACVGGYIGYKLFLPEMIAHSITEEPHSLVPDKIKHRLKHIRKPVNDGALAVVEAMHSSGVTMEQVLKAIDEAKEQQAFAFLDELNRTRLHSPDQVFSMAKKHFPVAFDVEIFRKPFNQKVSMAAIRKGIRYANIYKEKDEFDAATAKSVAKKILLQKEAEFRELTGMR